MKPNGMPQRKSGRWFWLLAPVMLAVSPLRAADPPPPTNAPATNAPAAKAPSTNAPTAKAPDTNAPAAKAPATNAPAAKAPAPALTPQQMFEGGDPVPNNWVEFSYGGLFQSGSESAFQRRSQNPGGMFGGIEDFHYQVDIKKGTSLAIDGRSMYDNHSHRLLIDLEREKLGYVKFFYDEYRTYYDGDGGYYPPTATYYPFSSDDALGLDRRKFSFEAGLRMENKPNITFKYSHDDREGDKSSTIWGSTHPALGVNNGLVQGLSPTFYDINEHHDSFQLDITHEIKGTEFGGGLRYDFGHLNDALKINQFPGEPLNQKITDRQGSSDSLFNGHAFADTKLRTNLNLSVAFSYSDIENRFSGSRVYGSDFDVGYVPGSQSLIGYNSLTGSSHLHEYVTELSLAYKPLPSLTVLPSLRIQKQDGDANSMAFETFRLDAPSPFSSTSSMNDLDLRERLDVIYKGITNWVLYARGEWAEGTGNLSENGGLVIMPGAGGVPPVAADTDNNRLFQKYSAGARWYPLHNLTLDTGAYYKNDRYNYNFDTDSTPNNSPNRYPAYLVMQNFRTWDGNLRVTWRPLRSVMLVSRYEYQLSKIQTGPDPISGLAAAESSNMKTHIFAQDVSWTPWTRLSLQGSFNYVHSVTRTPASDVTQAILNALNDYWSLSFSPTFVLDDKTDLKLGYFYYRAADYSDNSAFGVPYGSGAEQHSITAMLTHRLNKDVRVSLKYGYFRSRDSAFGGFQNNTGQLVYTSFQYRF